MSLHNAQISILREKIVDSFAGGGGASTGIELATGRVVDAAINHDPDAILMHKTNHPYTRHYQASVWDVDPEEVCGGAPVGLLWASPDCKHFSKAKGGKPVDKNIRGLSWVVIRWGMTAAPRVIMMENVEEIQTWGPVITGPDGKQYPDPERKGETFEGFIGMLTTGIPADHPALAEACEFLKIGMDSPEARRLIAGLGYTVEWRELVAADYGAPTSRKRFFLVARRDNRPVVWPEATHAPANSPEVAAGLKKPWRSAAEIIDWSLPCPSIFDTKAEIKEKYGLTAQRPLRPNTMRRVARGVDKFVIKSANPFLVIVNHAGEFRGQSLDSPLQTVTAKHGYGVADPVMAPVTVTNTTNSVGAPVSAPVHTVTTAGNQMLITPAMIQYHTEQTEQVRGQSVTEPIMTIDASNRYGVAAATLTKYYNTCQHGQDVNEPLHTIMAKDREGVTLAHMIKLKGDNLGGPASDPVQTITAGGGHHGVVLTEIVRAVPGTDLRNWPRIRAMLNEYCGYSLAEDEVILFQINGAWYFMADIGLRMLTPRELYRANGFPDDYIIDRDYLGNVYKKNKQVARCGNAVPPPFATALVRANLPEWCDGEIRTMAELERRVAV